MLNMVLIFPSIGMNELTSHRRTPAIIRIMRMVKSGITVIYKFISNVILFVVVSVT